MRCTFTSFIGGQPFCSSLLLVAPWAVYVQGEPLAVQHAMCVEAGIAVPDRSLDTPGIGAGSV